MHHFTQHILATGNIVQKWNSFFCILINYRGHHRKGVAIYDATQVNLQQKH